MKNRTACSKSWTDVNINFKNRKLGHCCASVYHDMPDDITPIFFSNSELIQQRRQDTLNNIQHSDCVMCWDDIESGNKPFKDWMNEWDDFGSAKPDVPQVNYIEMELDNICDLSCLYCHPDHSSKIAQEEGVKVVNKFTEKDLEVYKQWLTDTVNNSQTKIDIAFLGGEPTASKLFYDMINHIASLENMRGEIQVTTNGNTKDFLFKKFIDAMDRSKSEWAIHISNESYNQDSSLIRYGLDWERFESNLRTYAQHPKVEKILFDVAMNNVALPTFPKYVQWIHDVMSEYNKPFSISGTAVSTPKDLDVKILPTSFKKNIDQTVQIIKQYSLSQHNQSGTLEFLETIRKRIGSGYKENYIDIIQEFLKEKQEYKKTDKLLGLTHNLEIGNE